jgi:transcriptional regulator with XRE-family HTH domain
MTASPKLAKLVIRKRPEQVAAVPDEPPKKKRGRPRKEPSKKTVVPARKVDGDTPVGRFVAKLREKDGVEYKTTAEVAAELGVSAQWIRKVQRGTVLPVPSKITMLGQIKVYIYTPEDVSLIRRYLAEQQQVYANPGSSEAQVESWEEVKRRRERATQDEDRPEHRDRAEGGERRAE